MTSVPTSLSSRACSPNLFKVEHHDKTLRCMLLIVSNAEDLAREALAAMVKTVPMRLVGHPEETADAVLWPCRSAAVTLPAS